MYEEKHFFILVSPGSFQTPIIWTVTLTLPEVHSSSLQENLLSH